jgi:3-keto-disaccharide hydrolase
MSMPEEKSGRKDTQAPQPKRSLNTFFIISTVIVFLALSAGGFVFLQVSKGRGATPTTGTETPTPTPSSTAIYLETPPPQSVFYDTFKNNALGWSLSNADGYYRTLKSGKLTLTNTNPGVTLIESLPTNAIYDDFTVSVDLTILRAGRGDRAGIYVRGDSNMDHDYRIDINGDNTIDIAKEYLDSNNNPRTDVLAAPRGSLALNPLGEQNTIKLVMSGSQLMLLINGIEVSSTSDSDYSTGQIALFVHAGERSNGVSILVNRVEVDKPPDK